MQKTILITGASSGFGKACAERFAREGWRLIADIVYWVTSVPPHVNISTVEVMPVCQSCGPLSIHRREEC